MELEKSLMSSASLEASPAAQRKHRLKPACPLGSIHPEIRDTFREKLRTWEPQQN